MTTVDARGLRCPWPALRAARALRTADAIEVLADDPATARELAALATTRALAFQVIDDGHYRLAPSGR